MSGCATCRAVRCMLAAIIVVAALDGLARLAGEAMNNRVVWPVATLLLVLVLIRVLRNIAQDWAIEMRYRWWWLR